MKNLYIILFLLPFGLHAQIVPPYFDDFESGAAGWNDTTYSGSSWELGTPNFGTTSGAHSGTHAWDISLDSAYQNYSWCYLYSPHFDFSTTSNAALSFWLNYNTEARWDATILQYSTDAGSTWRILGLFDSIPKINWMTYDLIGNSGWWDKTNCWALSAIKLDSVYGFPDVQFRFQFTSDGSVFHDGVSIDDFSIYNLQNVDAAIASIISPVNNTLQSAPSAIATIANLGQYTLTSIPVGVIVNGGPPVISNYTGSLTSIQADTFLFANYSAPIGSYTICFFTALGDANPFNDTLCCQIFNGAISVIELDNSSFVIYPNPSGNNAIQIRNLNAGSNFSIQIVDAWGNAVYSSSQINAGPITINQNLASGIYFVRIKDGPKTYSKKLIVVQD